MSIKSMKLTNFRKHKNTKITFEEDLTVIVGENDTGKSSLLHAIQIVMRNERVDFSDFLEKEKPIEIEVEIEDKIFAVNAEILDSRLQQTRILMIPAREAIKLRTSLADLSEDKIKSTAKMFEIRVTSSSRMDTLKANILAELSDRSRYANERFAIKSGALPEGKSYFLNGLQFENIDKFVSETFFRARQKDLWLTSIEGQTLADFIQSKLIEYKVEAEKSISEAGIIDILRQFIPDLRSIEISPTFENKDLAVDTSVSLVTSEGERQSVSKFGDGTRRRVTLALLQHRARSEAESALYFLDEPDTHLHVRAQNELLDALDSIAKSGSQIILTTHSPFMMNSVDTRQVRVFFKEGNIVRSRDNIASESLRDEEFRRLGIENLHLFFSRKFVIVEGETEEAFLPIAYRKFYSRPISRDFIKVIKRSGISDVPRFAEALAQCIKPDDIFVVTDNDALPETRELIEALKTPNVFTVGNREFEDAFQAETVFRAWETYVEAEGGTLGELWTSDEITDLAFDPGTEKFSSRLREKNRGCRVSMTKPKLGVALANYCQLHVLPAEIQTLIKVLNRGISTPENEGS